MVTPMTIRNNPRIVCQFKVCLYKKWLNIAIENIPTPDHEA